MRTRPLSHEEYWAREVDRLENEAATRDAFWADLGKDKRDTAARMADQWRAEQRTKHVRLPAVVTWEEVWDRNIGRTVSRETFVDQHSRSRLLRDQTCDIADRLERVGIQTRTPRGTYATVCLVTGKAEKEVDFRNSNLLPLRQSWNVHDMLKHVAHHIEQRKNKMRMLVISGGWVPLPHYRENHKAHCRRITRFSHRAQKKFPEVEVAFYNVENTIQRDGEAPSLNLHSHALLEVKRRMPKARWMEFMEFARAAFPKGYVHDSKVEKAAEVVKYCFKPNEFERLTDDELGELWHQVHGRPEASERPLKFFHPLGSLRDFRARLKVGGHKLIRHQVGEGETAWRVTPKRARVGRANSGNPRTANVARAITAPSPRFSERFTPCVLVEGWTGDFAALIRENGLEKLQGRARATYDARVRRDAEAAAKAASEARTAAAGAVPFIRDTTTTTVHAPPWGKHPPPLRDGGGGTHHPPN